MSKVRSSSVQKNHDKALIVKYKPNSKRAKEITDSLIKLIVENVFPFSILNDTGFVNFVKVLNDKYELPNKNTLMSIHLPEMYNNKCMKIKENLSKVKIVHFTIDSWTDINRDLYFFAVTAHFCIGETLQRNTLQVSQFPKGNKAEQIQKTVDRAVDHWKIDSEVKTIVNNYCEDPPSKTPKRQILCFGRTLNLTVENAIKNSKTTINVIRKCRKIVENLQTSNQQISEDFPEILSLERGVIGRWSSTYLMLSRMNTLPPIYISVLSDNDWKMISEATSVLEPLYEATRKMSSDHYVTTSKIIPIVYCIQGKLNKLEDLQSDVEILRKNLLNQLDKYYKKIENDLVYAVATFLNPCYKGTVFRSENSVKSIKDHLTKTYGDTRNENKSEKKMQTVVNEKTYNFWGELPGKECSSPSFTAELDEYLNSRVIDTDCPITWWNTKGNEMFPDLAEPALEYLCIPALAAPSEHLFSNMGQIILDRRIRLQPKYVDMLAVLGWN